MGIMAKRSPEERKRWRRYGAIAIVALFAWSFAASPNPAVSNAAEVEEPATLAAYNAVADAAPVRGLIQHNTYLVSVEPAIARSTSEVSLPSQATSTSWLLDLGTPNGLHGTTTGNKVPTEATASQPGGDPEEEFKLERGTAGNDAFLRYGSGVARATALHSARPRGFGYGYLASLSLLPAPGSPEAPPGSYDPAGDAEKEKENPPSPDTDDPNAYTPNPRGQMAILAIGSVASTADTFREDDKVTAISVAELNGINIGNRTADGRCTNCITIDSLRVEARTESDGTKEGMRSSWRILMHRACRVAMTNDAATGAAYEGVSCLNPNPDGLVMAFQSSDPAAGEDALRDANARGVRKISTLDQINDGFAQLAKALQVSDIGITLRVGTDAENAADVTPNAAFARARGIVLELRTTAVSESLTKVSDNDSLKGLIQTVDGGCQPVADAIGSRAPVPVPRDCASAAVESAQTARTFRIALGQVEASTQVALGGGGDIGGGDGGGDGGFTGGGGFSGGSGGGGSFFVPPATGGTGGNTVIVGGGLQPGPLKMRIDWSKLGIKPWAPKDMGKAFFTGGLAFGVYALIRKRLRPGL